MAQYIPYSIRNNIIDPNLAGLLDYLERDIGEDEMYIHDYGSSWNISFGVSNIEQITLSKSRILPMLFTGNDGVDIAMPTRIFYRTYKSILPVIRDLYSK